MASSEQIVATFLQRVGTGATDDVRALLLAVPALVNAVGPHPFWGGRPQALHVAVETGRREIFDILLEHGANPDGKNDQYDLWSPLMLAINRQRDAMRDELIRRGARIRVPEALLMANDEMAEALLARGLPDAVPSGGSLLAFARTTAAIDFLVAIGAETTATDHWGVTPIQAVSRLGSKGQPLVAHMVSLGIAASPADFARTGDQATLAQLAEADASAVAADDVLMAAVEGGHHDLAWWLLARGANVNARATTPSRQTALHSAAWNGDVRMVALLVAGGADVTARDAEHDNTPLGFAETSLEMTNNPTCADVVSYLSGKA
jgi:ankyrin repeat protein